MASLHTPAFSISSSLSSPPSTSSNTTSTIFTSPRRRTSTRRYVSVHHRFVKPIPLSPPLSPLSPPPPSSSSSSSSSYSSQSPSMTFSPSTSPSTIPDDIPINNTTSISPHSDNTNKPSRHTPSKRTVLTALISAFCLSVFPSLNFRPHPQQTSSFIFSQFATVPTPLILTSSSSQTNFHQSQRQGAPLLSFVHPFRRTNPLTSSPSSSTATITTTTAVKYFPRLPNWLIQVLPSRSDTIRVILAKSILLLLVAVIIAFASTVSIMVVIQDSLVYKPTRVWRGNPASSGMPHYDDVDFVTRDNVHIKGWFIRQPPPRESDSRTVIYFHGTDKNASFRLAKVIGLYERCKCNILLISYRGYGLSTGRPNERGVRIDAESTYDYLVSRGDINVKPGGNLWVYGESLGGAVAIYFTNVYQHCINALILENTFTSLLDMIKLEIPFLGIFRHLSWNRWQSKKRIGHLHIPLLFLSGLKDAYIPPRMMKQMHSLAVKSPMKEFVEFENGTHNRTWTSRGFYDAIAAFMDRVDHEAELKQGASHNGQSPLASSSSSSSHVGTSGSSTDENSGGRLATAP